MKQRNQLITLGVLIAVLAVVAFVVLRGGKSRRGGAPAAGAAATTDATAPAAADGDQPATALGAPPTQAQLDALGAWLLPKAQTEAPLPSGVGFGLARNGGNVGGTASHGGAAATQAPVAPMFQGIIVAAGERRALIGGEAYAEGQKVRGSEYTVTNIGEDSVTLRAGDGREMTLTLVK